MLANAGDTGISSCSGQDDAKPVDMDIPSFWSALPASIRLQIEQQAEMKTGVFSASLLPAHRQDVHPPVRLAA